MTIQTYDSQDARKRWRDILDAASAGEDIVIERYGKPTAAVIPFADFQALLDELDDLRTARRAQAAVKEWEQNPSTGKTLEEFEAELRDEGLL